MKRKFYIDNIKATHLVKTTNNYAFFSCVDGVTRKIFTFTYDSTLSKNETFFFEGV